MRILLVEDDVPLAEGLRHALVRQGYHVDLATDGIIAREALLQHTPYDVVILDLGLPRYDGLSLLKEVRSKQMTLPIIILTARDDPSERVKGLDAGADDYVVKPFEINELMARVRAVSRRSLGSVVNELVVGDLRLDQVARQFFLLGQLLELAPREYQVLELLAVRAGKVVSKAQIQEHLSSWDEELSDGAIDIYIHRLRRKLENSSLNLRTIRGFGYLLQTEAVKSS